jgi:RyR domain-containing protein
VATYTPKPIDTSTVLLNNAQRRLIEQLVKKRVEDGWQHGPARNDQIKAHPSLVPYDELPDSEKDYDRVMVEQVIRAVDRLLPYRRFARSGAVGARARRSRVSRACETERT